MTAAAPLPAGQVPAQLNQANLKRTLTLPQALGISFHQIVGGGVVSLLGVAVGYTGGGVSLAFVIAAVGIMIISVPYAALGAAMPVTGGTYMYVSRLVHPGWGFVNMWLFVVAMASLSLYGLAAGSYLHTLNTAISPTIVAVVLISVFYIANMMGAAFSARVGILIAVVMLIAFGLFIVYGLAHTHWGSYPPPVPNGVAKLLQAAALLTFATGGGTVVAELGHEMKNPGKTIPIACLGGTVFAALLYVLIALPAAGVLPIAEVANQPLSVVAKSFLPHSIWVFFIFGGACLAVVGTMNAQLLWGSKSMLAAIDDGWFPQRLGQVNKRFGTPHYLLTILFVIGVLPAVTHIDIEVIASAASAVGQLVFMFVVVASLRMRYVRPELQRASPFRLSAPVHWVFTVASICVCLYQTYLLSKGLNTGVWIALAVWLALGAGWFAIRYPQIRGHLHGQGCYAPGERATMVAPEDDVADLAEVENATLGRKEPMGE